MYDYKNPNDLVLWAKEQEKKPNRYKNGGIGRYDKDGTRQFDCCGLLKCFLWHNYSTNNAKYYNKTQRDTNCEGLLKDAKEKGPINTIPEIPGVLVYQKRHMGIYLGNGYVIESTAKKFDGKKGRIYITQFKNKKNKNYRGTWTQWFKSNNLNYDKVDSEKPIIENKYPFDIGAYIYPKEDVEMLSNAGYGNETKWTLKKGTKSYVAKYSDKNGLYMALKSINMDWFQSAWTKEFNKFSLEPIIENKNEPQIETQFNVEKNDKKSWFKLLIEFIKKLFKKN